MNNVAEVESRAELVRAVPRCSNVSKKRCGSREQSRTCSSYAEMQQRLEEAPYEVR